MKLNLKNYGDYYLELDVTEVKTTIEKKEEAKELLSNLLNVAEGLKEYIKDKRNQLFFILLVVCRKVCSFCSLTFIKKDRLRLT